MTYPPERGTTPSRLYVSNLSKVATLTSLREVFASCGEVLDVEFAAERGARERPAAAYVTMATSAAADKCAQDLQGRLHCDRLLMVTRMFDQPERAQGSTRRAPPAPKEGAVTMTLQYRDRRALTYELSCAPGLLTLRFLFPPDDAQDWQVEGRLAPGSQLAVTASAPTRERAFRALVDAWPSADSGGAVAPDWERVAAALLAVRAL